MPIAAGFLLIGLLVLAVVVTGAGVANGASSSQAAVSNLGSSATTAASNAANKLSGKIFKVVASQESDGGQGSCGPIGTGGLWFSELSSNPNVGLSALDFAGLGKLPCGAALQITNPATGKTVIAHKRDVGAGSSFLPVMGLYPATAAALGLSGGQYHVVIQRADGGDISPVRGQPA